MVLPPGFRLGLHVVGAQLGVCVKWFKAIVDLLFSRRGSLIQPLEAPS